jgi:hypothetical protein
MKKSAIFIVAMMVSCFGCTKNNAETSKFMTGTYSGVKSIYCSDMHQESIDTITIKFDGNTYIYSGSGTLDFGRGNYLLNNSSIQFNDTEGRIALYSWEWILSGMYQFKTFNDSLILIQNGSYLQISCRLIKVTI